MKKFKYIFTLTALIIAFTSCDERMEEMNTDPLALSTLPAEYLFSTALRGTFGGGDFISSFHLRFASQYDHIYVTNSEMRSADQYFDFHTQDIYKEMFSTIYTGPLRYTNEILLWTQPGGIQENPVQFAMTNIVAVVNFAQAADCWGNVPYSQGAQGATGNLYPPYDTQESIYPQMMDRLKAVGGYFPKPNPNADPKAKRYDPNNLSDKGEGGDPEAGGADKEAAGKPKKDRPKKKE